MSKKIILFLAFFPFLLQGQQNQQLFHMHYLGQSNFLNPAVQQECKWFIGLPVVSSVHVNYANSAFTYRQLVENVDEDLSMLQIDRVAKGLKRRSFIGAEAHVSWVALGYKHKDYYFNFAVTEKMNAPITFARDAFLLAWKGNTQFEGEEAGLKGTASYLTHYREYAFGASKDMGSGNFLGIKAKFLFGKLNVSTPVSNLNLYTDPDYFYLTLSGDIIANMSAPVIFDVQNNTIRDVQFYEDINRTKYLLNGKNKGLAFDAGFIHQYSEKLSLSGSFVDLGFIRWKSDLNNLKLANDVTYESLLSNSGDLLDLVRDSVRVEHTNDPYFTMLPLKLYLGADYQLNNIFQARVLTSAVVYRTKFVPALTFGIDANPFSDFHLVGSYSLMYGAYNNFGLGFAVGLGPVQFYAISDNVAGTILPLSYRNVNLRAGLNIKLGCPDSNPGRRAKQCPAYGNGRKR